MPCFILRAWSPNIRSTLVVDAALSVPSRGHALTCFLGWQIRGPRVNLPFDRSALVLLGWSPAALHRLAAVADRVARADGPGGDRPPRDRSEEHTSELQS